MKKLNMRDRVIGSGKISTIIGLVGSAAIAGAAQYFRATGNVTDWKGYAVAGGGAAASALIGAMWKGKSPS